MERPPNFKRIVGVVKKLDNNYYGIGDGLGNFAFLTKKFIVGMHPINPLMWQNTIFLLENIYNVSWKKESTQYFNSYDYQTKTIPIPEPIPAEFLDVTPPQPMTQFHQPVPQPQPMPQQPAPQQPAHPPSIPVSPQQDPLPQIVTLLVDIKHVLIEQKALLEALCTLIGYTDIPSTSPTIPPNHIPNNVNMEEFINKPLNREKLEEKITSNSTKKDVPKIKW